MKYRIMLCFLSNVFLLNNNIIGQNIDFIFSPITTSDYIQFFIKPSLETANLTVLNQGPVAASPFLAAQIGNSRFEAFDILIKRYKTF